MSETSEDQPTLSVVIPCFNELQRLPRTVAGTVAYLEREIPGFEIIVVDDGSSDETADWAEERGRENVRIRTLRYSPNRGKGYAVKCGVDLARGRFILFMDADNATAIDEVEKLRPYVENGAYDVVIGSRAVSESKLSRTQPAFRLLLAKAYGLLTKSLALYGIRDTQCGFKLFTSDFARTVVTRLSSSSAIFDIELLMIATQQQMHVREVGVEWIHDLESRIQYDLKKSIAIFFELLRIKWRLRAFLPLRALTSPHAATVPADSNGIRPFELE
jgi:dolichyl-phosphate beta-glucosyltransferase